MIGREIVVKGFVASLDANWASYGCGEVSLAMFNLELGRIWRLIDSVGVGASVMDVLLARPSDGWGVLGRTR